MRFAICLTLCLFIATSFSTNVDTLQQMYNGYFEEAGLADPTTLLACYDESSAGLTVTFISTILTQLANYDVFDIDTTVKNYESQLPDSVKTCTSGNAEYQNVQKAYNMGGLTLDQIESQVANYAFQNLAKVHNDADSALTAYNADNFDEVGKQGGKLAKNVFPKSSNVEEVGDAQDDLQLLANGFWEQAGLQDPTSLSTCFDENSANITVTFIGNILNDLASSNIKGAESDLEAFEQNLPASTRACISGNPEITQVLEAYNIYGLSIQQLESKVESYALWHMIALHHDAVIANSDFQAGNYKAVGQEGGYILQSVFGKNNSVETVIGTAQDSLQQMAVGFWVQGGLADPTTIIQCFDESNANLTLTFIGNVINDISKNNINKAQSDASAFAKNLPKSVQDCVKENKEFQQILSAYKIAGLTTAQIESKVKSYALLHYLKLHQYTVVANSDFIDAKYKAVGQEGGVIVQSIFGKSDEEVGDSIADLQLLANGFWEQAGLADPTTVTNCFDVGSANVTVTFIGNLLNALANSNIKAAEGYLVTFNNSLPETVKTCLASNYETTTVLQKYKIYGLTIQQLESKIESYAVWHMLTLHHGAVIANDDFQSGNYKAVGIEGGSIVKDIFGGSESDVIGTAQDNLQQMAIGFWVQGGLADPTTIVQCFDESSANLTLTFIGNVIADAAKNNINKAESDLAAFEKSLPQTVQDCVKNNKEFQQVLSAYKVAGLTEAQIESKVKSYALLHYFKLHQYTIVANSDFVDGKYKAVGQEGGVIVQSIFGKSEEEVGDSIADLQLLANGFWEQAGLADPTTVTNCFDIGSANLTVTFIGNLLNALSNSNIKAAEGYLVTFNNSLPETVKTCLASNYETTTVLQKYKIYGLTIQQLESKIESYAVWHMLTLHHGAVIANDDFQSGNYKAVGIEGGSIIKDIFGGSETVQSNTDDYKKNVLPSYFNVHYGRYNFDTKEVGDSIADLQLLANGFWEQAGLADPTTVTNCFDIGSANLTVTFIGNLLNALANSNIKAAEGYLVTFNNSLPETVKTCLASNYETTTVLQKYKIYGLTIQQLESKIESYAVWHMLTLHHGAVIANDDFQSGNYKAVGIEGGSIVKDIFGGSESAEDTDYEGILQQYFNGFFEQVNLSDPTTIIADCFVPQTAQMLVEFIANVVNQLASKEILAAESTSLSFLEEFPKATQQCVYKNAEFQQAAKAYGIVSVTPTQMVEKVVAYAFQHSQQLGQFTSACNEAIQADNYDQAGKVIGQGLQAILPTESLIPHAPMDDPLQDLSGLLDGFWENVNLPDPTSAISCFDEPNAQVALTFVSELFSDLANDNLLDLPSAISTFEKQISPSVMSCLKTSPDIQSVGQAYGVTGTTTATLVAKVAKYALLHAAQFHSTAVTLNSDYSSAQYDAAGKLSGQLLQAMLSTEDIVVA